MRRSNEAPTRQFHFTLTARQGSARNVPASRATGR